MSNAATDDVEKLHTLIGGVDVAMLVTLDGSGRPCSRPMTTITIPGEADLWFAAPDGSPVVSQVRGCAHVTVQFVTPAGRYVVATGRAHLHPAQGDVEDDLIRDVDTWVPRGFSAAPVMLIHVNVDTVEYWESTSSEPGILQFVRPVGIGRARPQSIRSSAFLH